MGTRMGARAVFARVVVVALTALALAGCSFDFGGVDLSGVGDALSGVGEALSGAGEAVAGFLGGLLPSSPSYEEAKAQATSELTPTVSSPTLLEDGVLIVGLDTYGAYLPFLQVNDDESVQGLDVDVAAAVAEEMGLTVRYVPVSNASTAVGVTCDVVMGVSPDAAGSLVVSQYAETATALFRRGPGVTVTASDVAGTTVAVQAGSVSESALDASGLQVTKVTYDNVNDCFAALDEGTASYVACEAYAGAYLAMGYDDVSLAGTLGEPEAVGVGVAADNAELQVAVQTAVATLESNGRMAVVRGGWVGDLPTLTSAYQIQASPAAEDATAETPSAEDAASEAAAEAEAAE